MSIRIMCPSGAVRSFREVLPIVERKVEMNGVSILMREKAKSLANKPTGLLFVREDSGNYYAANKNLYIGNLPEDQIKNLLESINTKGVLRLCDMSYQEARTFAEVCLVPGTSQPYTNEFTNLVDMLDNGRFTVEPQIWGCDFNPFNIYGGNAESKDKSEDEDDSEDDDKLPLRDGIDITRPVSDEEFEERGEYQ